MRNLLAFILTLITICHSQSGPCPNPDITDDCGHCSSHDDPHIITLDGVRYDQHTDACFKYVTTCPSAAYALPFEVCGCHYDCGSGGHGEGCPSTIRCISDIIVTFFDSTASTTFDVTVDESNPTLDAIDSLSTSLTSGTTYTFDPVGHYFVYTRSGSIHTFEVFSGASSSVSFYAHIRYQPGNLEIYLNDDYFTDVTCGLCGYFTGVDTDDFLGFDSVTHLSPAALGNGPITASVVADINAFANTYLCSGSGVPFDPGCSVGADEIDCFNRTLICCENLWNDLGVTWDNTVLDEGEFMENWLIGCALDACALTFNNPDCDALGTEFDAARDIAKQTATAVYEVTPIETSRPTVAPTEGLFVSNCSAKICAHGDDKIILDVSYNGGLTWDLSYASSSDWKNTMNAVINGINGLTVFRFTVSDAHVVGGFIATIQLCGSNDYEWSFFTDEINTYFDVISDSAGDPLIDVFDAFGSGTWAGHVNAKKVECMNEDADWIWNDKSGNTMVFEFNFAHHTDILQRLECIEADTPAPTTDCCTLSLDDYMSMCYCEDVTTAPPSLPPISVATLVGVSTEKAALGISSGATALVNADAINANTIKNNALYTKINEEMKEIKYMMYATWLIIFSCAVINIGFSNNCCNKKRTFKSVNGNESDGP